MSSSVQTQLIEYLRQELTIPSESINLALRQQPEPSSHLHIILWQYGLISLEQLASVFDWLETITPVLTP
ncbi:hypothetical protein C1752_10370 [Acaryochloris thomasi RCC1774]|uniref:DUF2949 domain-containing protein n=1 Tax=Acaryochloris thomasi RCC1774 TaxID=1764569 RepID=A0A2W1J8B1_9CYAN|nr:DUF2949 domain-containing protein [Acaryochloris thomasi]PZD70649.1 hypothetical protein C1752_10370 [Acaryochloris thomasi RCC1774]